MLAPHAATLDEITALFAAEGFAPGHAHVASLPAPHYLVRGDLALESLELFTGTLVVRGDLAISTLDVQRDGRPLANIVVLGNCRLGLAYLDGFLVVRGGLAIGTFVGDTTWDGGLFVDGAVTGERLILHDMGTELAGENRVTVVADSENYGNARDAIPELFDPPEPDEDLGNANPRGYFLTLCATPR